MKKNLPVTQVEEQYSSSLNILSTTDTKGRMTYVNQDFVDVSGFEVSELLGQSHNMVRHPDMPQAAFSSLWETVKSGHSWMGIVKNRCKNGNHYWVDAYVTPVERDGEIAEYQSVRRKPAADIVARADKVYADLAQGKLSQSLKSGVSLTTKIFFCMLVPALLAALTVMLWSMGAIGTLISFVLATLVSCIGVYMATKPYRRLVEKARKTAHNPVSRYIYTGRNDDIGQIEFALKMFESETAGLIGRIADSAISLTHGVSGLSSTVTQAEVCARQQFAETDQVAAAVHEMSASIQEVAGNAQSSSVSASAGLNEVIKGKEVVQSNVAAIEQLMQEMSLASTVISQVETSSDSISKILDVIGDIADQTNLLALNAAIEAARAGERGRGFSVVAEEVRTLASKTQASTGEIRQMIEQLQGLTGQAVNVMKSGLEYTERCVQQSGLTAVSLNSILDAIHSINDMNTQIASAVEQQSMVADEISRSIYTIRDMSEQNLAVAETSSGTSQNMLQVSDAFKELSAQFWSKQGI